MGFQISLCKFHKNSLSEKLVEGKAVSQWDVLTQHTVISQNASFQFLTEDILFFTIALYGLPIITLQIPEEQPYRKASWIESCKSVRWINRTQSSFSESFFTVYNGRYFFSPWPSMGFQISLCKFHNNCLSERLLEWKAVSLRWINRTHSSFSETFFPVFNWRYFLFHQSPLWASKYHFENSKRTVLAKGFLRGKL